MNRLYFRTVFYFKMFKTLKKNPMSAAGYEYDHEVFLYLFYAPNFYYAVEISTMASTSNRRTCIINFTYFLSFFCFSVSLFLYIFTSRTGNKANVSCHHLALVVYT